LARVKEAKGVDDEENASNPDLLSGRGAKVEGRKAGAGPVVVEPAANVDGDLLEKIFWALMDAKGEVVDA